MKEAIVLLLVGTIVALAAMGMVGVHPTNAAPMARGCNAHQVGDWYQEHCQPQGNGLCLCTYCNGATGTLQCMNQVQPC